MTNRAEAGWDLAAAFELFCSDTGTQRARQVAGTVRVARPDLRMLFISGSTENACFAMAVSTQYAYEAGHSCTLFRFFALQAGLTPIQVICLVEEK